MQPVNNKTNCIGLSPLAMQVDRRTSAIRTRIVWGVCLHGPIDKDGKCVECKNYIISKEMPS